MPIFRSNGLRSFTILNKNIIISSFKSSGNIQKKEGGPDSCSDNQSSSVTLNKLAKEARKTYCNFEFQARSHTTTDINPTGALILTLFL